MQEPFWETRAIYVVRTGSHAYGTSTPASDQDTRGVCIPPAEYILGLKEWEQHEYADQDTTIYGLHKFVRLALNCNPNIIELLYVREQEILHITESGRRLCDAASLFLTRRAFKTFGRYAVAQLQAMHRGKTARHGSHVGLVETHGYDTKNAMHLIRLLRTGITLLRTGHVEVYRPDREELLSIRNGAWSLERVEQEAAQLEQALQEAYDQSPLPDEPDFDAANRLVMELTARALEGAL